MRAGASGVDPGHHDLAEILLGAEKLVADPEQVLRVLLLGRYSRPYTGMDEQIVAEGGGELEAIETPYGARG